jgi:hypothetical protein
MLKILTLTAFIVVSMTPALGFAGIHKTVARPHGRHGAQARRWAVRSGHARSLKVSLPLGTTPTINSDAYRLDDANFHGGSSHLAYESDFAPGATVSLGLEKRAGASQSDLLEFNSPAASMYQPGQHLLGAKLSYSF